MNKITLLAGVACIAIGSANTYAQQKTSPPELYLGGSLTNFDSDLNLETGPAVDFGIAFPVLENTSFEIWASLGETDEETPLIPGAEPRDFDVVRLGINGLYQIDASPNYKPHLTFGFSNKDVRASLDKTSTISADVGLGIKAYFADAKWIARGDFIMAHALNGSEEIDFITRVTFGYNFGEKQVSRKPVARKPAPAPAPAPVAVAPPAPVDSDGDGVFDNEDKCPSTAAKLKVGLDGCPIILTENVSIDLEVKFPTNSSVVSDAYRDEIKQVADFLDQYKGTSVEIQGYTDDRGAAEYNRALSEKRAKAVAEVLVNDLGVSSSRVSSKGYGEVNPVGDNNTAAGRAANRRVVAEVKAVKTTSVKK